MTYRFSLFTIILVLTMLLISCGEGKGSKIFVDYRRIGGFVGLDDHMVIDTEGNVILTRKDTRTEFSLDSDSITEIQALLDNAEFTKLKEEYNPSRPGSDLIGYTITYKGHTIQASDTAITESLQPILDLLNRIVENNGKP